MYCITILWQTLLFLAALPSRVLPAIVTHEHGKLWSFGRSSGRFGEARQTERKSRCSDQESRGFGGRDKCLGITQCIQCINCIHNFLRSRNIFCFIKKIAFYDWAAFMQLFQVYIYIHVYKSMIIWFLLK